MRASAAATEKRLGGPGQWLLNLPPTYVAGVQVLFRSVLAGMTPVLLDDYESFAQAADAMDGERRYVSLVRSEEHTSELQSLMRISYAVFCLKKKKKTTIETQYIKPQT